MKHFLFAFAAAAILGIAQAQVPDYVPTDGLVAWFPFNGNAIDESWNGHDAEVDGASLSLDRFGNSASAYAFDGNDRIFPSNPEGFPVAERTTSIWMKSNVGVTGGRALFGYGGGSCGNSWLLTYNNQGNQPYAYHSFELQGHCNAFATAAAMPSAEFENWHHIVLRTSEEGTDIFVDGVLSAESATFVNNTQPACAVLGSIPSPGGACVYQDSSNELWNGLLDDFAVWNRALTDEEIGLLYFADSQVGCTDSSACNFDASAYLDDASCEYGCNYCGPGTSWDAVDQICVVAIPAYLNEPGEAAVLNPCYFDTNYDGLVEVTDLMNVLSVYGLACGDVPALAFSCGDPLSYQGYDYETVLIGERCWFAENARYLPAVSPPEVGSVSEPHAYVFGYSGNDVSEAILLNGAVLYNGISLTEWDICPNEWHVPTELEWQVLELQLGMTQDEIDIQGSYRGNRASALKSESEGWQVNGCALASPGTDESGFAAEPVGIRHFSGGGTFTNPCGETTFWSSTDFSRRALAGDKEGIYRSTVTPEYGFSVRCVKDAE